MSIRLGALLCVLFLGLSINVFAQPPEGGGGRPSFAAAAEELGVTEEVLVTALRLGEDGPPDFAGAAEQLGVTEEKIRAVIPPPPGGATSE